MGTTRTAGMMVVLMACGLAMGPRPAHAGPFGLDTVIAFYGSYPELKSQTFSWGGDWRQWHQRGGVACRGVTHQQFLRQDVAEASDFLGVVTGDPHPVVGIDEFGWDFDGGIDGHCAAVLKAVHQKRPDLGIAVWQMRGPVAPQLAAVYRDTVDLVMLETYYNLDDAWMIPFQLQAARLTGLLPRTILALGLGRESADKGSYPWTQNPEELDQQLRLIRMVAPESPGVAFFGDWSLKPMGCPLTREQVDAACLGFRKVPTDGSGLRPDLLALGRTFTKRYRQPAIFCSSEFVLPHFHSGHDGGAWGEGFQPLTARVLLMNLGERTARGAKVSLRSPGDKGQVWAEGLVDLPARQVTVAALPILPGKTYNGWVGTEEIEVVAPGAQVFTFRDSRFHGKPPAAKPGG